MYDDGRRQRWLFRELRCGDFLRLIHTHTHIHRRGQGMNSYSTSVCARSFSCSGTIIQNKKEQYWIRFTAWTNEVYYCRFVVWIACLLWQGNLVVTVPYLWRYVDQMGFVSCCIHIASVIVWWIYQWIIHQVRRILYDTSFWIVFFFQSSMHVFLGILSSLVLLLRVLMELQNFGR
jgi:hypothetical protein